MSRHKYDKEQKILEKKKRELEERIKEIKSRPDAFNYPIRETKFSPSDVDMYE